VYSSAIAVAFALSAFQVTMFSQPALGQSSVACTVDSPVLSQVATLDLPVRMASARVSEGRGSEGHDMVVLEWAPIEDADCVWITARGGYDTLYPRTAVVSAPAGAPGVGVTPEGEPGLFCYLFIATRGDARGEHAETCVEVANPIPKERTIEPEPLFPDDPANGWDWGRTLLVAGLVGAAVFLPAFAVLRRVVARARH
jgi:hypothetical protein